MLPITYQWKFNDAIIPGAIGDTYLISSTGAAHEGSYTVTITNANGSVTSEPAMFSIDANENQLGDNWELFYFGNLNQAPGGDFDGDDISNLEEFQNGTNPIVREIYYWIASSGDFNTASNWSRNRVPGVGDTAVINSGTFTLSGSSNIPVSTVTVNAPFAAPAGANFSMTVSGAWTFAGPFSLANGRNFKVGGTGSVTVTGTTGLNGAGITASNGAQLSFPNVTSYTVPPDVSVEWVAQNRNTVLSFPNLVTITGPSTPGEYFDLIARYDNGALLSLPVLTTVIKPGDGDIYNNSGVRFNASDSTVSAPNLVTFHDNDPKPNSSMTAADGGVLEMPLLTAPRGVNLNLNAQSHPERFVSLEGTRFFRLNAGSVAMSQLTSITGLQSITASGGAQLSFPNVTSYTVPPDVSVEWVAQNRNTVLSFPNLVTITGPSTPGEYLDLTARYDNGALLSLPVLTTVIKPGDGDIYNNSGVRFNASDSTVSAPNLMTFHDNDPKPNSSMTAADGGVLEMPLLTAPRGVNINLNAQSHPERFVSLEGTRFFRLNAGSVAMSQLLSITGLQSITASGGAQLSFPNVTSYTVPPDVSVEWVAQNRNTVLSFPNLVTITGPSTPGEYFDLIARYDNGALLSLPVLTTVIKPGDGDIYNNSGVRFNASDSTVSAPNLMTFHDNDAHPR